MWIIGLLCVTKKRTCSLPSYVSDCLPTSTCSVDKVFVDLLLPIDMPYLHNINALDVLLVLIIIVRIFLKFYTWMHHILALSFTERNCSIPSMDFSFPFTGVVFKPSVHPAPSVIFFSSDANQLFWESTAPFFIYSNTETIYQFSLSYSQALSRQQKDACLLLNNTWLFYQH